MPDDSSPGLSARTPLRKVLAVDESAPLRHRAPINRLSTSFDPPTPGVKRSATEAIGTDAARRRSSNFSEYSLNESRKSFRSSTDDLLSPKPGGVDVEVGQETSPWHSAPLAFALLPAIGGLMFKNGSSVITDIMLLGLAAVFLNWSVRVPWDWYHSAQSIRKKEECNAETVIMEDSDDENVLSFSQGTLDEVPEEEAAPKPGAKPLRRLPAHKAATKELHRHEVLALLSCFIFPLFGAYMLHTIRSQLSRSSEGLISDYNLTIFVLASELRPMAHIVKLIRSRTMHLQRIVASNPYDNTEEKPDLTKDLLRRLEDLEARSFIAEAPMNIAEATLNRKQSAVLITEVRRNLQPDLDALNRTVRRYEKRATLHTFQTESRLLGLEARLNDAISLAAAAANNGQRQQGFTATIIEWIAASIVLPLHAFTTIAALPLKTIIALIYYGKTAVVGQDTSGKRRRSPAKHASNRFQRSVRR
ncbi:hypothetical protein BJ878DRAFT_415702 [Calycina marina]|uniref:Uncharacterized protein n=1 Tax=Calycina marina TaxID=1763456 RepID=A0A9P7Z819_9HELO|nr:hypothetical protein BJ878DRAFT_415702 [Calycina marina]